LDKNDLFLAKNILFLVILSIFNWFFEILKWQNLVSFIKNISFFEALKQSLAALTASLFTPNRIGEYGAKAAYFTKPLRKRILLLNLLGNIAQMTTTLVFGIIGFSLFNSKYDIDISPIKLFRLIALVVIAICFSYYGPGEGESKCMACACPCDEHKEHGHDCSKCGHAHGEDGKCDCGCA